MSNYLRIAKENNFANLNDLQGSIVVAESWVPTVCSYSSILTTKEFGKRKVRFRRDPVDNFPEIINRVLCMLAQDLVVIVDEMMEDLLAKRDEHAGTFPQSKIEKLSIRLNHDFEWARRGCLELVAVRNALTHNNARWNEKSIAIIRPFTNPVPSAGDRLVIGFPMLFRYRKAIRTFLNEIDRA